MPPVLKNKKFRDADTNEFFQRVVDWSGTDEGPVSPLHALANTDGTGPFDIQTAFSSLEEATVIMTLPSGATPVVHTLTTPDNATVTERTAAFTPQLKRPIYISIYGETLEVSPKLWRGSAQLERSFDGGTIWIPITRLNMRYVFTGNCSEAVEESTEAAAIYSLLITATDSTVVARISH